MSKGSKLNIVFKGIFTAIVLMIIAFGCSTVVKKETKESKSAPQQTAQKQQEQKQADTKQSVKVEEEEKTEAASLSSIKAIDSKKSLPLGYFAGATKDDYLLKNEEIEVFVAAPNHVSKDQNIASGCIIDLTNNNLKIDYLQQIIPIYKSDSKNDVVFSECKIDEGKDENKITFKGNDKALSGLKITNEYSIKGNGNYITYTTTLENNTTQTLSLNLGDTVEKGFLTAFVPGAGVNKPKTLENADLLSDWVIFAMDDFGFAISPVDEMKITSEFGEKDHKLYYKKTDLPKGQSISYSRYIVVGTGSHETMTDTILKLKNIQTGTFLGIVQEETTRKPIKDAEIRIIDEQARPYMRLITKENGKKQIKMPFGKYHAKAYSQGRKAITNHLNISLQNGGAVSNTYYLSSPSSVKYKITDADTNTPLSGKIQILPIGNTKPINFGPEINADKMRNCVYSASGQGSFIIPKGVYKLVTSCGIEYNINEQEVKVEDLKETVIDIKLKRAYSTKGYISADLAVHTINSYNSPISEKDRLISAIVEGVECVVTADNNHITDLSKEILTSGLKDKIYAIPGFKIVPDFNDPNVGEYNVFPVEIPNPQDAAVDLLSDNVNTPEKLFKAIRTKYPKALIEVTNPLIEDKGMFSLAGFDIKKKDQELPKTGVSYDFDMLGLFEGRYSSPFEDTNKLYFKMLIEGYSKIPVAGGNSHFTFGDEVGYPRMYVAVDDDNPATMTTDKFINGLKSGNFQITNGPFIDFKINGQTAGSIVKDTDGTIDCELNIYAPSWVSIRTIDVNKEGVFVKRIYSNPGKDDNLRHTSKFQLKTDTDYLVNIAISGNTPYPYVVNPPNSLPAFAFTSPILIDTNGNGKYDKPKPKEKK